MDAAFLDELASAAPTPGGGGASACVGAVAAALASMVGQLTVGKKRYADVEAEVTGALGRLALLRTRLVALIDADAAAFAPLALAYAMPKSTPDEVAAKEVAMQDALVGACDVPLDIMRACVDVLCECEFLAHNGSRMAISDAGACAVLAHAAAVASSLNVYINISSLADSALAQSYDDAARTVLKEAERLEREILEYVASEIGMPSVAVCAALTAYAECQGGGACS